jgi:hypothetical protein
MDFLEKFGIKIENKCQKEQLYEEFFRLNLNKKEADSVYEYYINNRKEFMINPKVFLCPQSIVQIIIQKLNLTDP